MEQMESGKFLPWFTITLTENFGLTKGVENGKVISTDEL